MVAKTTSQVRKLRKHKSKGRQVRKKRLEQWRAAHQNQTAEKALKSVVPVVKKKKKASLKNKASAKHKPSLKQKASAKEKKKKKSAKKQAAKNAAAAEVVESETTGPLCGKSVAVVGEAAPAHLSGRTVVVQAERELEVLVEWQGQQAWVQKADLDVECKAARQQQDGHPSSRDHGLGASGDSAGRSQPHGRPGARRLLGAAAQADRPG